MAMIHKARFLDLARRRFGGVFRRFQLHETGTHIGNAYAELIGTSSARYLIIGIDQRQDYRVYVKIGKAGADGKPMERVARPLRSSDVVEFDLESIVAQSGRSVPGFGSIGAGTLDEVDVALRQLAIAVEDYGSPLLEGGNEQWDEFARAMFSRGSAE